MTGRLILSIFSSLLEETAIVVIVLWGLPQLDIHIPLGGLIAMMVVWGAISVITYRMGSRALSRKPEIVLPLISSKGKVVSPIAPDGMVRIKGELWQATSASGNIGIGEKVTVVGQDGLKLVVREDSNNNLEKG